MKFIDTNVILRFLLADKAKKYKGVYELFCRLEDGTEKVECKTLVLFQVVFVLKSFYKIEKEKIAEMMLALLDFKGFHVEKKAVLQQTLELWKNVNKEIIDCYILSCMEEKEEKEIYSYDKDFDGFGITRIEP